MSGITKNKIIHLAVAEFALPAPRKGSIEAHSGLGRGPQLGQELHSKIQQRRAVDFPQYQAEVLIAHTFSADAYQFEVRGRMDGFFGGDSVRIEEIKSTFNVYDLLRTLKGNPEHPYSLQLKTYGYFYWLQHKKIPALRLHLVSSRNGDSVDLDVDLDLDVYEAWVTARLQELVAEVKLDEKRIQRRKKAAKNFVFPFPQARSGQIELIETIEQGMAENRPMLLQAPTGLGKTVGVLYPTLKEAMARGQKVVYITPKNSQHTVAEEAIEKLQEVGAHIKSLTITAKSKMCFKNEPLCNPDYCEYAKDHYTKVAENKVIEQLAKKRKLTARVFKNIAAEYEVCPFELQLDAAQDVDTVICDYNYVFAPRTSFGRLAKGGLVQPGKPNLVIDEAHNLPSRAIDYYSPALSVYALEKMREDVGNIPRKFRSDVQDLITNCIRVVKSCAENETSKAQQIDPPFDVFLDQDIELKSFLSSYLAADIDIQPRDVVMRLSFYWSEFTGALEYVKADTQNRFFTTYSPNPPTVKITCCDASEMLKDSYDDFKQVVAFSATLKPFEFYSQLAGLKSQDLKTAEFKSPFAKENRKILVIPQISSKYSDRERNYPRIAETIEKIAAIKQGNYIAFFPSFDFMERVFSQFKAPQDTHVLKQERSMRKENIEAVLDLLKDTSVPHILFAVQGGVFSEGVDYPGRMVIGAFVVGPPLPNFDLEREKMREYYQQHYSAGFDYAYTYPAMAKAVQAAGRVIRSETDLGLIVMMDNRFIQPSYVKSMPQDWFEENPQEMVSQRILQDVADFWRQAEDQGI